MHSILIAYIFLCIYCYMIVISDVYVILHLTNGLAVFQLGQEKCLYIISLFIHIMHSVMKSNYVPILLG